MLNSVQKKMKELLDAVQFLEDSANAFCVKIGRPKFIVEEGKERFKYSQPTPEILQVLKAVRVVSGLNAMLSLLEKGFVQEIGVLSRTIDDFLKEIYLIQEGIEAGTFNKSAKRFIDQFFMDDMQTFEEYLAKGKPNWVHRREIASSQVRFLGKFGNLEKIHRNFEFLDYLSNGYVHGGYPQIMELYIGGTNEGFRMKGVHSSNRLRTFQGQIVYCVSQSFLPFAFIAKNLRLLGLFNTLKAKSKKFGESDVYQEWRKN